MREIDDQEVQPPEGIPTELEPQQEVPEEEMSSSEMGDEEMSDEGGEIQEDPATSQEIEDDIVQADSIKLGPAQELQLDAYRDNATIAVFSAETQDAILQSLQSGENPIDSVAQTAFLVHKHLEQSMAQTGEKMTEVTMVLGAAHLVSELIYLAEAAGLYELDPQSRLEAFRHGAMKYFEAGLKDGSIDPVELQKEIEPLMTPEQRQAGEQAMNDNGIMKTPPPSRRGQAAPQPQPAQQQGLIGGQM